jgi:hypothetical protein
MLLDHETSHGNTMSAEGGQKLPIRRLGFRGTASCIGQVVNGDRDRPCMSERAG